jgi:hypothetical protein
MFFPTCGWYRRVDPERTREAPRTRRGRQEPEAGGDTSRTGPAQENGTHHAAPSGPPKRRGSRRADLPSPGPQLSADNLSDHTPSQPSAQYRRYGTWGGMQASRVRETSLRLWPVAPPFQDHHREDPGVSEVDSELESHRERERDLHGSINPAGQQPA